jgi:2-isopropylmalate synthase
VMGKHTGAHSVRERLNDAGFAPTDEEVRAVTRRVKDKGADDERVTMQDVESFAQEVGVKREDPEEVRA